MSSRPGYEVRESGEIERKLSVFAIASCPKPSAGSSPPLSRHFPRACRSGSEVGHHGIEQRKPRRRDAQPSGAVDLDEMLRA